MVCEKNLKAAISWADALVESKFPDATSLVARKTKWRSEIASEKQIRFLKKKKINVPDNLKKGQASHLISLLS